MNYYVNIVDTADNTHTTILEDAKKSSIVLSYDGSDDKDDLKLIGSTFRFTMYVDTTDAAFIHLFTGDEQRYKIELRKEADDMLIWHGFLLPDLYSEPYKNNAIFVEFQSTDGIGRLRGKYLPDAYYKDEHPTTTILAECLKLTGLSMDLYFSPSIENKHEKNYHLIYVDGSEFWEGDKKKDAYSILDTFAGDLLFCVFQSLNIWHLEGLNKRNLLTYQCKHYDSNGGYIADLEVTRNIKDVSNNAFGTPTISMVPPYGIINVSQERTPVSFVDQLFKESNDGWVVTTGVNPEIYVTEWIGTFDPKAVAADYNVIFYNNNTNVFDQNKKVQLLNKLYLNESEKYKLSFKLRIGDTDYNQEFNAVTNWYTPIEYKVTFNGATLFSNFDGSISDNEKLYFLNEKSKELSFEFAAPDNGLLDVIFYQPYKTGQQLVGVYLDELKIEPIGFVETETFTDTVSDDYTKVKDQEITFADDGSGATPAFLLSKLKENSAVVKNYTIPILYTFTQNGLYYSVVQLDGGNLIKENITTTTHDTVTVNISDVIYNYQDGEQMCVVHDVSGLSGNFIVGKYYKNDGATDRSNWYEWTDSVYEIETNRFGKTHANVIRRMFTVPHPKIDLKIGLPVLFNDLIKWNYVESTNYFITNIAGWSLDDGKVDLTMVRAVYQNDDIIQPGDNIPPIVDAGETIYLTSSEIETTLTAVASDPDGFIASYLWEWVSGTPVPTIGYSTQASTPVFAVLGDQYQFKVTVTDDDGATASDTVRVERILDFTVVLTATTDTTVPNETGEITTKIYNLTVSPPLPDNYTLNLAAKYEMDLDATDAADEITVGLVQVIKNGVYIVDVEHDVHTEETEQFDVSVDIPFNINNTDTIQVKLQADAYFSPPDGTSCRSEVDFFINAITFVSGSGNITNTLPINREALAEAP